MDWGTPVCEHGELRTSYPGSDLLRVKVDIYPGEDLHSTSGAGDTKRGYSRGARTLGRVWTTLGCYAGLGAGGHFLKGISVS